MEISRKPNNEQIPAKNKRICKRDRHSKIKTAKGLRDRRMRLSLEVAKRFFGLQDILGFDKASKTVEWLLNQSKDEIKQLAMDKNYNDNDTNNNCSGVVKSASSTSECEGVSGLDDVALSGMNDNQDQQEGGDHHQSSLLVTMTATKRRSTKSTRKSPLLLDPLIARESREKARERARERTKQKQKMKMKSSRKLLAEADVNETTNHNCNLTQFGSWNPFETGEKVRNPTLEVNVMDEAAKEDEPNSQANDDDPLAANMIFNSLNTTSTFLQDVSSFNLLYQILHPK